MTLTSLSRQRQQQLHIEKHCISSHAAALGILGLPTATSTRDLSVVALSQVYFTQAKKCHPPSSNNNNSFLELTAAYEFLLEQIIGGTTTTTSKKEQLGISDECKQNPMFHKWLLLGRTDGAQCWRQFFLQNGELTQKLAKNNDDDDDDDSVRATKRAVRRRRRSRRQSGATA